MLEFGNNIEKLSLHATQQKVAGSAMSYLPYLTLPYLKVIGMKDQWPVGPILVKLLCLKMVPNSACIWNKIPM